MISEGGEETMVLGWIGADGNTDASRATAENALCDTAYSYGATISHSFSSISSSRVSAPTSTPRQPAKPMCPFRDRRRFLGLGQIDLWWSYWRPQAIQK